MTARSAFRTFSDGSRAFERLEVILPVTVLLCVVLAFVLRVDVVARAPGIVMPSEASRPIHATRDGIVAAFEVADGDLVQAGDPLVRLTDPGLESRLAGLRQEAVQLQLESVVLAGLLAGDPLDDISAALAAVSDTGTADHATWTRFARAERALDASIATEAEANLRRLDAQMAAVAEDAQRVDALLLAFAERHQSIAELEDKGSLSRFDRIDADIDLGTRQRERARIAARRTELGEERLLLTAQTDLRLSERRAARQSRQVEVAARIEALGHQIDEMTAARDQLAIAAPVAGVVQEVAVARLRQMAGREPLLVIVPSDGRLLIDARLPGRDIAFVEPGQSAKVLLESYSLTRFGTVDATVLTVSEDATQNTAAVPIPVDMTDRRRLLADANEVQVQPAYRVTLAVDPGGTGAITLRPGMSALVNIRTSDRRLIDYFLDPLLRAWQTTLRER